VSNRTRRDVLVGGLSTAAIAACRPAATGHLMALPTNGERPRNVVVILTDDQRWDGFGFMGHPVLQTPALDGLARSGAWCSESFVTTSLCCPSRASMLTGLYAHAHGVLNNQSELEQTVPTYGQYLAHAGVDTAYIGKWHMGGGNPHPRPGWSRWIGFRGQGRYHYPGPETLHPLDRGFSWDGTMKPTEGYVTDLLTDHAVDYVQSHGSGAPFCLVVAHKACHAPFQPAPRHADALATATPPAVLPDTDEAYASLPPWLRRMRHNTIFGVDQPYGGRWPDFTSWYRDYHRTLLAVDESVARILAALDAAGIAEQTAVLYTSDNGFMFGEKGVLDKRVAYEPSIRVPLLARVPGLVAPGSRIDKPVLNVDVAPTVLDLMGLTPPPHMHGRSLRPVLADTDAPWRKEFLYTYFHERRFPSTPTVIALRTPRFKYITHHGLDAPPALYDLKSDPEERVDLCTDPTHAERARSLAARLDRHATRLGLHSDPVWGEAPSPL